MVNVLRLIASIILMSVSFFTVFLGVSLGISMGYAFTTPMMGIVLSILCLGLGTVGILLMIDAIKSD
jgi:hypothetical protein